MATEPSATQLDLAADNPPAGTRARKADLVREVQRLRQENAQLRQQNRDLEIALNNTAEHGDFVEASLYETNCKLEREIDERLRAEATLQALVGLVTRQKNDLEIIVQTIMEHGDVLDNQWHQKLCEVTLRADLDGLTQVPNRRRLDEYLEQQWQRAIRDRAALSLVLCDIDCFKPYNDTYGHLAGDKCLKQVAESLSKSARRPSDLVARYGGEEFAMVLPHTRTDGAMAVARRAQAAIAELDIPHAASVAGDRVTLSVGVFTAFPTPQETPSSAIAAADRNLYLAKRRGRNRIVGCPSAGDSGERGRDLEGAG